MFKSEKSSHESFGNLLDMQKKERERDTLSQIYWTRICILTGSLVDLYALNFIKQGFQIICIGGDIQASYSTLKSSLQLSLWQNLESLYNLFTFFQLALFQKGNETLGSNELLFCRKTRVHQQSRRRQGPKGQRKFVLTSQLNSQPHDSSFG